MNSTAVSVRKLVADIEAELQALPVRETAAIRAIRRKYSRALRLARADVVLRLARELCRVEGQRWFAYELIANHAPAFNSLDASVVEDFGRGLNSWGTVDSFARILAGPAWLAGRVPGMLITKWARSKDRWWRRASLVSTVALNVRSQGGTGDVPRTLRICRMLAADHEDMVAKGLSWALRQLIVHDAGAVRDFLTEFGAVLNARVKREVKNKLNTGLKSPQKCRARP